MQFLGRFCMLVVVLSALELYKKVWQVFLGLFLMDFASCFKLFTQSSELKNGFLLLGFLSPAFSILSLFLMFGLGFKYLQCAWHGKGLYQFLFEIRGKSGNPRIGFSSKSDFEGLFDQKIISCEPSSLKCLENLKESLLVSKENANGDTFDDDDDDDDGGGDGDDDYGKRCYLEDEEFDVMALRRLVKIERLRADMANIELEKERMASASAAEEAMAMILRLQSEKSSIEIEANHNCRIAEQMQEYDQEIIQYLQVIIIKHESERTVLEKKLGLCKEKLGKHMTSDEMEQFEMSLNVDTTSDDGFEDVHTNSLEENDDPQTSVSS